MCVKMSYVLSRCLAANMEVYKFYCDLSSLSTPLETGEIIILPTLPYPRVTISFSFDMVAKWVPLLPHISRVYSLILNSGHCLCRYLDSVSLGKTLNVQSRTYNREFHQNHIQNFKHEKNLRGTLSSKSNQYYLSEMDMFAFP